MDNLIIKHEYPDSSCGTFGVDVSHYNTSVDWASLYSQGVRFAWIKCTEGTTFLDPFYALNYRQARASGMVVGTYHYLAPNEPGEAQAHYFMEHAFARIGDLLPAVDIEAAGDGLAQVVIDYMATFANTMLYHPIVYSDDAFYQEHLADILPSDEHTLWIARLGQEPTTLCDFTQYSFGNGSNPDRDYYSGSLAELKANHTI